MNVFRTTIFLFLCFGTTSLIAREKNCDPQNKDVQTINPMPGYNASAQMETNGIGMYSSASFIYWQALQDGMELAYLNDSSGRHGVPFDFTYKPGFKVCLGGNLDYDNWDVFADYTWFHTGDMTTSISTTGFFSAASPFLNGPLLTAFFVGDVFNTSLFVGNNATRKWNLKFDSLDGLVARSFRVGKQLNMRPSFGVRAAWIRQRLSESLTSNQPFFPPSPDGDSSITNPSMFVANKAISWGVGLKGAVEGNWNLGKGFQLFGYGAFDLLYTRYNLSNKTLKVSGPDVLLVPATEDPIYAVRSHSELELGFSYNTHFNNDKCFVDIAAGYGFQVFWNQNMFLEDIITLLPSNQLVLQGLRLTLLFAY